MESTGDLSKLETFNEHRPRLFGLAYRMLGIRDDAEDILQETYIRWHKTDAETIETPEAWLVTAVTRLSIDRLRKASVQRETYIGPWLPEPLMIANEPSPEDNAELASGLSLAFMVMLERLSPTERAVFLLHDIFDCDYSEISRIIGKSEAASRQIVHRARERVRTDKPRFEADEASRANLIRKFVTATYAGDEQTLLSIFADDVALTTDGGGKVHAARRVVYGSKRLARLYTVTVSKHRDHLRAYLVTMNGETSVVEFADGQPVAATAFSINDGKIIAAYRVMNPDKLKSFLDIDDKYRIDLSQN
jgi:RNA polymerase sigma-70 factor (ECF subfamily)